MKKRSKARELVLQAQYAWEISENKTEMNLDSLMGQEVVDDEILDFAGQLYRNTTRYKEELDSDITSVLENWDFKRIALVDRLILRIALCELLYFDEIPPKVTINEAIDLAKKYSTSQSGRFVNGILDSLFQKYKKENRIAKKGRGLMES